VGLRGFFSRIGGLLRGGVDENTLREVEEMLIAGDVGAETAGHLVSELRRSGGGTTENLSQMIADMLKPYAAPLRTEPAGPGPVVWLVVGANGTGKTTTLAKLASRLQWAGKRPLLAAGDTFRAAAVEQLGIWAERLGAPMVAHRLGSDAAAVIFDAIQSARSGKADAVLADTAGRLHTKHNLMEELKKIARAVARANERPPEETLLVLDATTGQNALAQAKQFSSAIPVSGLVLTKLDGTAKGGTIITIAREVGLPIKAIGTGESAGDLEDFDPGRYARLLFEEPAS